MLSNEHIERSKAASYERDRAFQLFWKLVKTSVRQIISLEHWRELAELKFDSAKHHPRSL